MSIYLVRHGESTGNAQDRFSCRVDHPLTDKGISQASLTGRWLAGQGVKFNAVYCSPLERAIDTADLVSKATGGPGPIADERIIEYDCGQADGLPAAEVRQRWPEFFLRPVEEWADHLPFGGESYDDVSARITSFRLEIEQRHKLEDEVLIVAHGGSLPHLLVQWCAWPLPRLMHVRIANCCCIKVELSQVAGRIIGTLVWSVNPEIISR